MRIPEALKILEDVTLDCKKREIDTPQVKEALVVLEPHCEPKWRVTAFRESLRRDSSNFGPADEGQQQVLRVCFAEIHKNVRQLISAQIGKLPIVTHKRTTRQLLFFSDLLSIRGYDNFIC